MRRLAGARAGVGIRCRGRGDQTDVCGPGGARPGLSRLLLVELERRAAAAGRRRLVLETGTPQPEAIGLYTSSGYSEIPRFGVYRCEPVGASGSYFRWRRS